MNVRSSMRCLHCGRAKSGNVKHSKRFCPKAPRHYWIFPESETKYLMKKTTLKNTLVLIVFLTVAMLPSQVSAFTADWKFWLFIAQLLTGG